MRYRLNVFLLAGLGLAACDETGTPTEDECPGALTEAAQTCTAPECSATEGLKTFGTSELDSAVAQSWVVPVWAASEVAAAGEMTTIGYKTETAGALSPRVTPALRASAIARAKRFYGEAQFQSLYTSTLAARVRAEAAIRAEQKNEPVDFNALSGTGIRPRFVLPENVHKQGATCSGACTDGTSLCVIPTGAQEGTCETALTIRFKNGAQVADVAATVKKVGMFGAIVTDDALNVPQAQIDDLLTRFDTHIAPLDHQFFGQPKNASGKDRDGNGVVIIFLTPKVAERGDANLVGYFASDDLGDPVADPSSNGADILYMREPGGNITLDQLSGTIGHEYQHLINYYAKVIVNQSDREEVWLDEGLAAFAEDMLGYGSDAFENIAGYLGAIDQTSLTGEGNCPGTTDADSICRRGMAHLLVRYFFEQKGGATFGDAGQATDGGGIAAVKKLVQSSDTGTFSFSSASTGRSFDKWLGDLISTVAIDGAGYAGVSCNPMYKLDPPEVSTFTNYQRGIDLRTSFKTSKGTTVNLTGPITADLTTEEVPLYANAGEIRTINVSSGKMKISVAGAVDYQVGYHAVPATKQ